MLGRAATLDEALDQLGYRPLLPSGESLEDPDGIYLNPLPGTTVLTIVYRPRPGVPESAVPGVGALLTQFEGDTERGLVEKGIFTKGTGQAGTLEAVDIAGHRGFWIEGDAHFFFYRDENGHVREETYRLAGNVLLWEQDGLTPRLESALSKEQAIAIAKTVRPLA